MGELKTLKDIEKVSWIEGEPYYGKDKDLVNVEQLREEAKKWINSSKLEETVGIFIKHFFNIEEPVV